MAVDWKNLQSCAERKFADVKNEPGIYFLRWTKGQTPVIINRIGGSDNNGLLYIGESQKLKMRFQRLWRGIKNLNRTSKHSNTLRKTIFFCKLHEEIKVDEYEIAWQQLSTKIEAQIQEAAALKLYVEKFKELPPLNLKLCREKYAVWGLGVWDQSRWSGKPNEFVKTVID